MMISNPSGAIVSANLREEAAISLISFEDMYAVSKAPVFRQLNIDPHYGCVWKIVPPKQKRPAFLYSDFEKRDILINQWFKDWIINVQITISDLIGIIM